MPTTPNPDTFSKNIPILISIVSLLISGATAWISFFLPSKIKVVTPNRIAISADQFTDKPGTYSLNFTLTFYNSGAKYGIVNDILIILKDEKEIVFRSYLEYLNKTTSMASKEIKSPESREFNSFPIKGKENVIKTILFRQNDLNIPITLTSNKYAVLIYLKTNQDDKFEKQTEFHFQLDKDDLNEINKRIINRESDGRYFVQISERNKVVLESEDAINSLLLNSNQ